MVKQNIEQTTLYMIESLEICLRKYKEKLTEAGGKL